ncbi:replication restart helicase PriA [Galbibacter mesophilus]|uniref:replication restart helicase PriA n=1 Tax=Galbibacter mesophilus TaxID=379069 RepID=UPI00191E31DB|nr:primosomal protein N' [Galbibacter mesophilus]MCM5663470.1 primosomal protein N' [Galbibacter mesophilus]
MHFIDVILPIPLEKAFTYEVSAKEASFLQTGMRVAVPFGKSKIYTALVYRVHNEAPQTYDAKEIDQILDEYPIVSEKQLKHWEWIASYYMCSLGEVFKAAVPSAFLLESETLILRNEAFEATDETSLKDDEWLVFEALQHQSMLKVQEVSSIIDRKNILPVLKRLLEKNVIQLKEEVYEQYKPKLVRYVKLGERYISDEKLNSLIEELSRAHKQREVVLTLFSMEAATKKPIKVKELEEKSKASSSVVKALIDKGILEEYHLQQDRVQFEGEGVSPSKGLNEFQQQALGEIDTHFATNDVVLLHGVTSSGKTEVYVKLIEKVIAEGKQVLYLLPEIALTTQLIKRLQDYFGNKVSVYHSKYSVNERVEVWNNILQENSKAQIVIGARSAVLLPFRNLGLIIVDEEHETSFKQFDPAPRYHARDAAIVLSKLHEAKTLLGTATPSIESFYNVKIGKYKLATIDRRYGNVLMPDIELTDIKEKHRKKRMTGHFSDRLIEAMQEALEVGEQIILFQNRRGFAPILECNVCGHSPHCPNCDVSLTYHQYRNQLRCHYCGYAMALQEACLACGSSELDTKGFGTEQVEAELKEIFPNAKLGRMDSDTTRGKYGYEKIITAFEQQEIDILVGTQMLTKGLDFRNVSLVGIMNADSLLNFPDFRAHERSFQLIQQVAGRAGRTKKRGKVIVQTYNPYHQILQQASLNRYEEMFVDQINERKQFRYPPFIRMIKITFKHRDYNKVNEASTWYAQALQTVFGKHTKTEILGPEFPPVARIRNEYLKNIVVKIPNQQSVKQTKLSIKKIDKSFNAISNYRSVRIIYNVDVY